MNPWTYDTQPAALKLDRINTADGALRVAVTGEIDVSTGDGFEAALLGIVREPGVERVVLDLGLLSFLDSNGVRILVLARRTAAERGTHLVVANTGEYVRSVLETLGVYDYLAMPD